MNEDTSRRTRGHGARRIAIAHSGLSEDLDAGGCLYMVGLRGVANPGVGREQSTAQAYPGGVGTPAGRTFSFSEATA